MSTALRPDPNAAQQTTPPPRDANCYQGTTIFVTVRVDGVVVVPMQDGYAYTHTGDGRCVLISGPRARMLELWMQLRQFEQDGGPHVYVNALEFPAYAFLTAQECPLHVHAAA
jgi:hypothetical protein